QNALNDAGKAVKNSHIHICGVAYKKDIDDVRESPALDIMLLLEKRGARVTYSDPQISRLKLDGKELVSQPVEAGDAADCVVIVTDHSNLDYQRLVAASSLIVDTRNALRGIDSPKIVRL